MSKKKEDLVAEAHELAKELGVEVKTEGLNGPDLEKLVAGLEDQYAEKLKGGSPGQPPRDPPAPGAPAVDGTKDENDGRPPKPVVTLPKHPLQIAPGKAVTHGRAPKGHLREGDEVFDADPPGQRDFEPATLALLIRKGVVLDNRKKK